MYSIVWVDENCQAAIVSSNLPRLTSLFAAFIINDSFYVTHHTGNRFFTLSLLLIHSDIHYIKIIARNIEMLTQWRMAPSIGIIQVFLVGPGAPYYMEMPTFIALVKHIEKNPKWKIYVPKTSSLYIWNPLGIIKDL